MKTWKGFPIRDTFRFGTLLQISIEKSAMFPERLCPGSAILYEVTLNNQSGQATGNLPASIEDPIPADTKYISGSVSENAFFDSANNRVVWTGTLGVGGGGSTEPEHLLLGQGQPGRC